MKCRNHCTADGKQCRNEATIGCYCQQCWTTVVNRPRTPAELKRERDGERRYCVDAAEAELANRPY